ncbi:MAG: T9SS type A sorting domain-containing protein [Fibrobacter sp.]|nr:T9SS type A sorting domain-containing protein [Fibrobacter sp.]
MPPNTDQHYIYDDTTRVLSDCEDWQPDGTGQKKSVNVDTWRSLTYAYPPEDSGWTPAESPYSLNFCKTDCNFYVYWRQNIPGRGVTIPYQSDKEITNWWQFIGAWDSTLNTDGGLWKLQTSTKATNTARSSNGLQVGFFNGQLQYGIGSRSDISIEIYDLKGRIVFSRNIRDVSAGYHVLNLSGHASTILPSSGSYIVSIKSGTGDKNMCVRKRIVKF